MIILVSQSEIINILTDKDPERPPLSACRSVGVSEHNILEDCLAYLLFSGEIDICGGGPTVMEVLPLIRISNTKKTDILDLGVLWLRHLDLASFWLFSLAGGMLRFLKSFLCNCIGLPQTNRRLESRKYQSSDVRLIIIFKAGL